MAGSRGCFRPDHAWILMLVVYAAPEFNSQAQKRPRGGESTRSGRYALGPPIVPPVSPESLASDGGGDTTLRRARAASAGRGSVGCRRPGPDLRRRCVSRAAAATEAPSPHHMAFNAKKILLLGHGAGKAPDGLPIVVFVPSQLQAADADSLHRALLFFVKVMEPISRGGFHVVFCYSDVSWFSQGCGRCGGPCASTRDTASPRAPRAPWRSHAPPPAILRTFAASTARFPARFARTSSRCTSCTRRRPSARFSSSSGPFSSASSGESSTTTLPCNLCAPCPRQHPATAAVPDADPQLRAALGTGFDLPESVLAFDCSEAMREAVDPEALAAVAAGRAIPPPSSRSMGSFFSTPAPADAQAAHAFAGAVFSSPLVDHTREQPRELPPLPAVSTMPGRGESDPLSARVREAVAAGRLPPLPLLLVRAVEALEAGGGAALGTEGLFRKSGSTETQNRVKAVYAAYRTLHLQVECDDGTTVEAPARERGSGSECLSRAVAPAREVPAVRCQPHDVAGLVKVRAQRMPRCCHGHSHLLLSLCARPCCEPRRCRWCRTRCRPRCCGRRPLCRTRTRTRSRGCRSKAWRGAGPATTRAWSCRPQRLQPTPGRLQRAWTASVTRCGATCGGSIAWPPPSSGSWSATSAACLPMPRRRGWRHATSPSSSRRACSETVRGSRARPPSSPSL